MKPQNNVNQPVTIMGRKIRLSPDSHFMGLKAVSQHIDKGHKAYVVMNSDDAGIPALIIQTAERPFPKVVINLKHGLTI
jgi:hypothetical protein